MSQGDQVRVVARSTAQFGDCPTCQTRSAARHGWHPRVPQDLPCIGQTVRLELTVRRFRCDNPLCVRRTFVERFPGWLAVHARRTDRLTTLIRDIGFEAGGESGARLLRYSHVVASGDSILRVLRQTITVQRQAPRVIGIDDWAIKRGRTYGTIIVDLEAQLVVDVLPDRTTDGVAGWLRQQPHIEIVARDRSTEYANATRVGAPRAVQVADRWHLLVNIRDMVERWLGAHHATLRALPMTEVCTQALLQQHLPFRRTQTDQLQREERRAQRVADYHQVQQWRRDGHSVSQIARWMGWKWETARKYYDATQFPERKYPPVRCSILDPYRSYLERRHAEGCENASQLWREIKAFGYPGTSKQVLRWMQQRRTQPAPFTPVPYRETCLQSERSPRAILPSARQLAWLIVKDPEQLSETERLTLAHIQQEHTVTELYSLAQRFVRMIRQRQVEQLDPWLAASDASDIAHIRTFANGIQQDYAAIRAALATPWSNGQTEGQVTRLKLIKRQMYGRAHFDLLRLRVLHPT